MIRTSSAWLRRAAPFGVVRTAAIVVAALVGVTVRGGTKPARADEAPSVTPPSTTAPSTAYSTTSSTTSTTKGADTVAAIVPETSPSAEPVRTKKAKAVLPPVARALLHVTPGALGTPWTFELTNDDTTPLRLATDGRLLTLDVSPANDGESDGAHPHRKKKAAIGHCTLPSELRPSTDNEKARIVLPGVTYVEEFDPRFYCFEAHEAGMLVPGAKIVAHLGWTPSRTRNAPPFVADEGFREDVRTGVRELTADAIVVPDRFPSDDPAPSVHALAVHSPARIDAEVGRQLVVDIAVENTTSRPIRIMLRPETLMFEVASPKGVHACAWKTHPAAPIAEVFTTIPAHSEVSSNVQLASLCPDTTFETAGLYTVRARLDTRRASGRSIGIDTFDGVARASEPTLVRIRHDRARRP